MRHLARVLFAAVLLLLAGGLRAQGSGLRRAPAPQWPYGGKITQQLVLSGGYDPFTRTIAGGIEYEGYGQAVYVWQDAPRYEDRHVPFAYEPYDYRYGYIAAGPTYRSRHYDLIGARFVTSKLFTSGWFMDLSWHPETARSRSAEGYITTGSLYSQSSGAIFIGKYNRSWKVGTGLTATSVARNFTEAAFFLPDAMMAVGVPLSVEWTPTSYSRYRLSPTFISYDADGPLDWALLIPIQFSLTTPVYWTEMHLSYRYSNDDRSNIEHFAAAQFRKYYRALSMWGEFAMNRMTTDIDTEIWFYGGGLEVNVATGDPVVQGALRFGHRVKRVVGTDDLDETGFAVDATVRLYFRE